MTKDQAQSFTDLVSWQVGHQLVLNVYNVTNGFPPEERLGLTHHLRQSAVSITANIAKGFSRATATEMAKFYVVALGALTELQNHLIVARDVSYLSVDQFNNLAQQSIDVQKLLHGLVRAEKQGKAGRNELLTKFPIQESQY